MKLHKVALGMAAGILWGATIFLATWWIVIRGGTGENIALLGRFYIGYTPTPVGSIIGLVYGFIDGFIAGYIFALIYNAFAGAAAVKKAAPEPTAPPEPIEEPPVSDEEPAGDTTEETAGDATDETPPVS